MNKRPAVEFVFAFFLCLLGVYEVLSYDTDETQLLEELLNPPENPSIQVRALRRELLKRVQEALEKIDDEEDYQKARAALARWNTLPEQKRNLQALARGGYIKTLPDEDDPDSNYKRSLANLAKNGQLPKRPEDQKRGIGSLARNGELRLKKELLSLMEDLSDKRHVGSSAKNFDFPSSGKRSLSSLAKSGDLYKHSQYKRSPSTPESSEAANALGKQSSVNLMKPLPDNKRVLDDSRRGKRDADYYYENGNENYYPVYQNIYDYDDLIQDLREAYPEVGKRFLGRLPQMGKPKSTATPKTRRYY